MKKYMYIICEKTHFDRLGRKIDDEINLYDSNNVQGLLDFFKKQNINITKRTLFNSLKNKTLIKNTYNIYKIKVK